MSTAIKKILGKLAIPYLFADANLQGLWRFNSNGNDDSGNARNLTVTNSPAYVAGLFGRNAIDFERDSSQYAEVASTGLNVTGSQSWGCWFKAESINDQLLMGFAQVSVGQRVMYMDNTTGKIVFLIDGLTTNTFIRWSTNLIAGKWYHVVGVYDSANSKLKLYIDGSKEEVTASGTALALTSNFAIGRRTGFNDFYFDGLIQDAFIFNRALTDVEVADIFYGRTQIKKISGKSNIESEIVTHPLYSDTNLQGYWRLENANDSGPNGNNLSNNGSPSYVAGKFSNGVDLESGSSQYLYKSSPTGLNITGSQTWSAWIKSESLAGGPDTIASIDKLSSRGRGLVVQSLAGDYPAFECAGLTTNTIVNSTKTIKPGIWNHVVGIYDSASSKLKIFVNGEKTEVTASGTTSSTTANFAIGTRYVGGGDTATNFFDGIIDDVAVWNRALTDAEVLSLYQTQVKKVTGISNV